MRHDNGLEGGRRSPVPWIVGGTVAVVIAVAVAVIIDNRGTSGAPSPFVMPTTSTSSRPVSATTSVIDLLVRPPDFPPISDNHYGLSDPSQDFIPNRSGPLDACDRLMWPEKEYPDLVHRSAYYDPPPEHGGRVMTATIYMRELPALGVDFDQTMRDCPGFDRQLTEFGSGSIGTATYRTTLTALDIPSVDGEHRGMTVSESQFSSTGTSSTSPDEHRLVGVLRGVTFVVSASGGSNTSAAETGRDLATLFNNQRQRILDPP